MSTEEASKGTGGIGTDAQQGPGDGQGQASVGLLPDSYNFDSLSSPIVTFRVGPEPIVLTAHKNILMKGEYFAGCLSNENFEEGVTNTISLPDEDPQSVVAMIRFLYTDNVLSGGPSDVERMLSRPYSWDIRIRDKEVVSDTLKEVIAKMIVADRYCINAMYNKAVGLARSCIEKLDIEWCHLEPVIAAGLQGSELWQLLSRKVAEDCEWNFNNLQKLLDEGLRSAPEAATSILEEIAKTTPWKCQNADCDEERESTCRNCR